MQRGSQQTEKTKELLRKAHLGKTHTPETKKRLSDWYWVTHRKESENGRNVTENTNNTSGKTSL